MRKFILFLVLFASVPFLYSVSVGDYDSTTLLEGKNEVFLNLSSPHYVSTLVKLNPSLEAVSYREGNTTLGYINVFGGIGEDFVLYPRTYELISSSNTTLLLPDTHGP